MTKNNQQAMPGIKILITTISLMLTLMIACNSQPKENINYCNRVDADQSHLPGKHMTTVEKEKQFVKRKKEFSKNWDILKSLISNNQLTPVGKDSCYQNFMQLTFVHTIQNYPDELFNTKMMELIAANIGKEQINIEHLRLALQAYKRFALEEKRCKAIKPLVDAAISSWKLNENLQYSNYDPIENIEYIDCQKN